MKTFLTLAFLTALAVVGQHANARLKTWQLSVDIYDRQIQQEAEDILDVVRIARLDTGTGSADDVRRCYQLLDKIDVQLQEMDVLLNHKPYDLHLTPKEIAQLDKMNDRRIKLNSLDRRPEKSRPVAGNSDSPAPGFAPANEPPAAIPRPNPRATPDPRQVAEDIARKYGAKPAP